MNQAAKAQEPSMEEILASIRRIIADDEATKPSDAASPAADASSPRPTSSAASENEPAAEPTPASSEDLDIMLADFEAADNDPNAGPPREGADVLELTPAMEAKAPPRAPSFRTIEPATDVEFAEGAAYATPPQHREVHSSRREEMSGLMSQQATAAVTSAFGSLAHTVLAQNARTLDDLVSEMLRPMLKSWLDDNLPTIVERLVRAEIERVSRGRG